MAKVFVEQALASPGSANKYLACAKGIVQNSCSSILVTDGKKTYEHASNACVFFFDSLGKICD